MVTGLLDAKKFYVFHSKITHTLGGLHNRFFFLPPIFEAGSLDSRSNRMVPTETARENPAQASLQRLECVGCSWCSPACRIVTLTSAFTFLWHFPYVCVFVF